MLRGVSPVPLTTIGLSVAGHALVKSRIGDETMLWMALVLSRHVIGRVL